MKKFIIIAVVLIVIAGLSYFIYTQAQKKIQTEKQNEAFGGRSREEFKALLQDAWKDRHYEIMRRNLTEGKEPWEIDWQNKIQERVESGTISYEDALQEALDFAWSGNPKANDNPWSAGWLAQVYVKDTLGLDPTDPKIKEVLVEI